GDRRCHQAAGATLGHYDLAVRRLVLLDHAAGEIDDFIGQQRTGHDRRGGQTWKSRWFIRPAMAPRSPPASSGSIGATNSMTRSSRVQFPVAIFAEASCTISASTSGRTALSGRAATEPRLSSPRLAPALPASSSSNPDFAAGQARVWI